MLTKKSIKKAKFLDIKISFLSLVKKYPFRIKFFIYRYGARPLKCSGYLKDLTRRKEIDTDRSCVSIQFAHFKCGGLYARTCFFPLKNIRFLRSSYDNNFFLQLDSNLEHIFDNHFEDRIIASSTVKNDLSKFSFLF